MGFRPVMEPATATPRSASVRRKTSKVSVHSAALFLRGRSFTSGIMTTVRDVLSLQR